MSRAGIRTILIVAATLAAVVARAEPPAAPRRALFALVVGVNRSVDAATPPLHYADDDAAQYLALFRALGAQTYVLSRLDDNTARLHPQASAEAKPPTRRDLDRAIAALASDVAQARERHVDTAFYFVYAGHGNVKDGEGYLALEDARLDAAAIEHDLVDRVHADHTHVVIDACYSFFLAYGRGPGGTRRPLSGFSKLSGLAQRGRIGLLLSTSSARESHEWEGFQAGVFSHEVRSGLYGAADSDGDGIVSYREIAAFVERANAAIPNERFRPDVFARPPSDGPELLDLRAGLARRIEIDAEHQAHYLLEDQDGVRLAELHNGQAVHLVRPPATGKLYLRRVDDDVEFELPTAEPVVQVATLAPETQHVSARGAAHEAFGTIFSLPYDHAVEESFVFRAPPDPARVDLAQQRLFRRWNAGVGLVVVGGTALLAGAALPIAAIAARSASGTSEQAVAATNRSIHRLNLAADVLYGVGAASAVTGAILMLLPPRWRTFSLQASSRELGASFTTSF